LKEEAGVIVSKAIMMMGTMKIGGNPSLVIREAGPHLAGCSMYMGFDQLTATHTHGKRN